jgi:hypothetical protein
VDATEMMRALKSPAARATAAARPRPARFATLLRLSLLVACPAIQDRSQSVRVLRRGVVVLDAHASGHGPPARSICADRVTAWTS